MSPIKNIPDLFNAYDNVLRLSRSFFQVQLGKKKGLFSEVTMELVLPIEYDRIELVSEKKVRVWIDDLYDDITFGESDQIP